MNLLLDVFIPMLLVTTKTLALLILVIQSKDVFTLMSFFLKSINVLRYIVMKSLELSHRLLYADLLLLVNVT